MLSREGETARAKAADDDDIVADGLQIVVNGLGRGSRYN